MTTQDPSSADHESAQPEQTEVPPTPGTARSHSAPRPIPNLDPETGRVTDPGQPGNPSLAYPPVAQAATAPAAAQPPAAEAKPPAPTTPDPATASGSAPTAPIPQAAGALPPNPSPVPPAATSAPEVTTTQVVPAGPGPGSTPTAPGAPNTQQWETASEPEWPAEPAKRTSAHLWGVLAIFVLSPVTWFLLTDGALRTFYSLQEVTDSPNIAGLLSLAGGLIGLLIIALVTRASSLGAWIWGGLVAAVGVVFLAIPQTVTQGMVDNRDAFLTVDAGFGTNLYNYLLDTGRSGLLLTFGVVLLLFALVAHTARRSGRTEQRLKAEYEATI